MLPPNSASLRSASLRQARSMLNIIPVYAYDRFVRCRVFALRRDGRRLPWREVFNAPSFEGELSTHYLSLPSGRYFVAKLIAPGDALCKPLLPELYEPVLTIIGNGG